MSEESKTIYMYTMPEEMPCGPGASCCGPIGQTESAIQELRSGLEQALPGAHVEIVDVRIDRLKLQRNASVLRTIQALGAQALPVLTIGSEVVSVGPPQLPELVAELRAKLSPGAASQSP